jgi:hypothetical protein
MAAVILIVAKNPSGSIDLSAKEDLCSIRVTQHQATVATFICTLHSSDRLMSVLQKRLFGVNEDVAQRVLRACTLLASKRKGGFLSASCSGAHV